MGGGHVAHLTNQQLDEFVDQLVRVFIDDGSSVRDDRFGRIRTVTVASRNGFGLVKTLPWDSSPPRSWIEVAGGGAWGCRPDPPLFRHLATRALDFDWGGPFARVEGDGLVTFGTRLVVPSSIIAMENLNDMFPFITGMVDALASSARTLAEAVVPHAGGTVFHGRDVQDDSRLFQALVGPSQVGA